MNIPLVVTLGVHGHRSTGKPGNPGWLKSEIQKQFVLIKSKYENQDCLSLQFILISPLAEGAERIFVNAILELEPTAKLIVPIPFAKKKYENTFCHQNSVREFNRYLAYPHCIEHFVIDDAEPGNFFPVGKYVVDHSDITFFISDGSGKSAEEMNGGTAYIQRYADFNIQQLLPSENTGKLPGQDKSGRKNLRRIKLPVNAICTIDTAEQNSSFSLTTGSGTSGAEKNEKEFFSNKHVKYLQNISFDLEECDSPQSIKKAMDKFSEKYFDKTSFAFQGVFDRQSLLVVSAAFVISMLVLFDWASGGNDFFLFLGPFRKIINWDSMSAIGLLFIVGVVLFIKKRNCLQKWVDTRYISERLRQAFDLLYAGIPLSMVIKKNKNDPSHRDMTRIWFSLYFYFQQQYKNKIKREPTARELKNYLLQVGITDNSHGLFYGQFNWHKEKISAKRKIQRRYDKIKNGFFFLSILTSASAAAIVILNIETTSLANLFDITSSTFSLLLAATATFSQLKEHGKVANRYLYTCEQLSEIYRRLYFVTGKDQETELENIRKILFEGSELLMRTTYSWMYTMQEKDPDWT